MRPARAVKNPTLSIISILSRGLVIHILLGRRNDEVLTRTWMPRHGSAFRHRALAFIQSHDQVLREYLRLPGEKGLFGGILSGDDDLRMAEPLRRRYDARPP